jgi:SAM-dependent methyltransferase
MDKEKWMNALDREFTFHEKNKLRSDDEKWSEVSLKLLKGLGVDLAMESKTIIDAGCGSRLCTWALADRNNLVGIDPLIDRYIELPFSDLNTIEHYGVPLEEMVGSIEGTTDVVICLNVLDHCLDPARVLSNLYRYLKPGGEFYLWTDLGHLDDIHEGDYSKEQLRNMIEEAGFKINRMTEGIDPYDFAFTDEKNYRRCGAPCAPGVNCICVHARRPARQN